MLKATYIVCCAAQQVTFIAGGAWLTYSGGSGWWFAAGVALTLMSGIGFTKRVNSWGDLGEV